MALILGVKYLVLRLGLRGEVRGINGRSEAFSFTWGMYGHKAGLTFGEFNSIPMECFITVGTVIFTLEDGLIKGDSLVSNGRGMF